MYKTNSHLYRSLLGCAVLITAFAFCFQTASPWFAIFTGIGAGGIASIIVAWLIDLANCREKAQRGNDIIGNIWATLCFILTAFPPMYIEISANIDHKDEKHTWICWKDLLVSELNKTPEETIQESLKDTFTASTDMFVREALYIINHRAQLIADGIITERWVYSLESILQEISLCKTMMDHDKIRGTAKHLNVLSDRIQFFIEKDDAQKHMNTILFHDLVDFDEEDEKARKHKRE